MGRNEDAILHYEQAQSAEKQKDYLFARVEYMKCIESYKQAGDFDKLALVTKEYEDFVKNDPIFNQLKEMIIPFIRANPGIIQSEITSKFEQSNWQQLYDYDRPVMKDDIYYVLYFADKFGDIFRIKKGHSYELQAKKIN